MIQIRELKIEDAPLMLEWMHDPEIQRGFKRKMTEATLDDVKKFIGSAYIPEKIVSGVSLHYAIVDDSDEYLGTVSIKNLDLENKRGEYAIVTRKNVHGKGTAFYATGCILKKAFTELGLHKVYLSVYSNNDTAIGFYEKAGFKYEGEFRDHFIIDGQKVGWKWYSILKEEYEKLYMEGYYEFKTES